MLVRMKDPSPALQAWLTRQPLVIDAAIVGSTGGLLGWLLLAWWGTATWALSDAVSYTIIAGLPVGTYIAWTRRRKADQARRS